MLQKLGIQFSAKLIGAYFKDLLQIITILTLINQYKIMIVKQTSPFPQIYLQTKKIYKFIIKGTSKSFQCHEIQNQLHNQGKTKLYKTKKFNKMYSKVLENKILQVLQVRILKNKLVAQVVQYNKAQQKNKIKVQQIQRMQSYQQAKQNHFQNCHKLMISLLQKLSKYPEIFFKIDYTLYHIHFMPGNHTIQRKFADFRKLRSILQNMYPHIPRPYLQPQGWLTSSEGKDTEIFSKHKWMVIDFLKYIILRNEELKNCPLIRNFCGYSTSTKSEKDVQEVSKQDQKKVFQFYENLPKPKNIG